MRVKQYFEDWYIQKKTKIQNLNNRLDKLKIQKEKLDSLFFDTLKKYAQDLNNYNFRKFKKKINFSLITANTKINETKEELNKAEIFIDEDFIYTYKGLEYLEDQIEEDEILKSIIFLLLDEINEYAEMNYFRTNHNEKVIEEKKNKTYQKRIQNIDSILESLPPLLDGFHFAFESILYSKEDLILRDKLLAYKKRIEIKINKQKKVNDSEYEVFRRNIKMILELIHSHYNIQRKSKELDNVVKGLRPILFKSSKKK